jgi:energy-coupling factor transport system ATP-binding protein
MRADEPSGASSAASKEAFAGEPDFAASLENVTFTYDGGERPAVHELNLALRPGETVGVMGASGAGKSTLAKCLNRLVPGFEDGDFHGRVMIRGRALEDVRVCDIAPLVGMVFQDFEAQLFSTNAALEVAFTMQQVGMERHQIAARIGPALEGVGLAGFENRDPTSLSGGEKQRLAIAAVLALRPSVIVFDEPTTDLDPEGRAEVFALIRRLRTQGLSLIVIEHEAEELRECDRIVLMREGDVIAQGTAPEVMTQLELLEQCGVHPPDLNRALAMVGLHAHVASVDEAELMVRSHFPSAKLFTQNDASRALSHSESNLPMPEVGPVAAPLVETHAVSFSYAQGPRVLDSISLRIAAGEFVAIVGQNGSGKTTLAKHIVGLLTPTAGRIMLAGRDRAILRPAETAYEVGYVFQNPDHQIFAPTVEDEVAFGPRNFGLDAAEVERRVAEVLHAVNLDAARKRDPFLLSKGERQRLAVASVLALRPRLLILDEPTTGLDYREQRRMMGLITELNQSGIAIVIITHTPWLVAEYAERVLLMRKGRILFDGAVRDFFRQRELLRGASFRPPEITLLAERFGISALRPEEFASWLGELQRNANFTRSGSEKD